MSLTSRTDTLVREILGQTKSTVSLAIELFTSLVNYESLIRRCSGQQIPNLFEIFSFMDCLIGFMIH